MKRIFIRLFFCGTPAEYEEGKRVHFAEMKIYRKRWYFIVGILFSAIPALYLFKAYETWDVWFCVFMMAIGGMLTRDTISEHYVVKLLRIQKNQNDNAEKK